MEITEIRIKLVNNPREKLRAFASVTFDGDLVIRDIKIIEGADGLFVAMPSRKLAGRCPRCGGKNHLRARFCNDCGARLAEQRIAAEGRSRVKLHADIAHPVNARYRERLQQAIVEAFHRELEKARLPGYEPATFEDLDEMNASGEDRGPSPAVERPAREKTARPRSEPGSPAAGGEGGFAADVERMDASFSDYNALIAELKRSSEVRRDRREHETGEKLPAENRPIPAGRPLQRRREPARDRRPRGVTSGDPAAPPAEPLRSQEPPVRPPERAEAEAGRDNQEFGAGLF